MMTMIDIFGENVKNCAIVGHVHPDGDCAGSVTAAYLYLTENCPGLTVVPFLEPLPSEIAFLTDGIPVRSDDGAEEQFDLCISLDASDLYRIGAGKKAFESAKKTWCLDHHETNSGFADENYVLPDASSTCEVLCTKFDMERISKDAAVRLYTGMVHDTGVFTYDCTSGSTLRYAADLIDKGIPFTDIIRESVKDEAYSVLKLKAEVIANSTFYPEERLLYAEAPVEMQHKYGLTSRDLSSVVVALSDTKEADVILFMYQYEDLSWKGSMRSRCDISVSELASALGGGGHRKAAGFSVEDHPELARDMIRAKLREKAE